MLVTCINGHVTKAAPLIGKIVIPWVCNACLAGVPPTTKKGGEK